jgi:hypothetical protein
LIETNLHFVADLSALYLHEMHYIASIVEMIFVEVHLDAGENACTT